MRCPFCGAMDTKVIDSRLSGDNDQIRRRRECLECQERFTTYETAELNLPRVVKSNGSREPFSEKKLLAGLQKSLEKRPVAMDDVHLAMSHLKHQALVTGEREIASGKIGEWVMEELLKLDHVAYIRFASVYLSFEDIASFREVIERLEKELSPEEAKSQLDLLTVEKKRINNPRRKS
ncbi:transcriptional regulator NrdR [Chromatiales bacterium (ex Bugula neritina AB1)]|nr:transcriptional regulator NrdR [Chromatiales bacterium (ex Bugula neritina AB1)]